MHMQTIEQTISDRKIKENIEIYIWIDLFAYMYMHICPTVTPTYLPSQMARSLSDISALSSDTNLYSVCVELCSSLLCGASSLLASTSEAHWPALPNSCMSCCLIITPLEGVMIFNHIQMSTSDRLSDPSSSCQMAVGTPSGLCCHVCSMDCIMSGVPSLIVKHGGFFNW